MVAGELRKGSATFWLATLRRDGARHVRPVFAAWTGTSFVVASNHDAAKSRNMRAGGRATITTDIGSLHIVVEGHARRVTDRERLQLASRAMQEVFGWPTEVVGEELDAEYGAPTSVQRQDLGILCHRLLMAGGHRAIGPTVGRHIRYVRRTCAAVHVRRTKRMCDGLRRSQGHH